jgi:hypothetical protein
MKKKWTLDTGRSCVLNQIKYNPAAGSSVERGLLRRDTWTYHVASLFDLRIHFCYATILSVKGRETGFALIGMVGPSVPSPQTLRSKLEPGQRTKVFYRPSF